MLHALWSLLTGEPFERRRTRLADAGAAPDVLRLLHDGEDSATGEPYAGLERLEEELEPTRA
ncbi:MAG TPA: hypothetical protein VMF35_13070 [Acidimicrobiales bacterium]|nr:hypothetical protein [Acidimicrobiales bacterium]